MPTEAEYIQAHKRGMTVSQRRDWIRKQAKKEDSLNLPFRFLKPKTKLGPKFFYTCPKCTCELSITRHTVLIVCPECKTLIRIKD